MKGTAMKVHKEMFTRWEKYVRLLLAENKWDRSEVKTLRDAWTIAHRLHIPEEAYHVDLNDKHIETALRKIFPQLREVRT